MPNNTDTATVYIHLILLCCFISVLLDQNPKSAPSGLHVFSSACGKIPFRVPYYTFWIRQPHLLVHVIADLSPCINREGNPRLTINGRKQGNKESFETSGCSSTLIHFRCFYLCRLAGHNDEIYTVSDFSMHSHVITGSKGGEYPSILHLSMPETGQ